MVEFIEYKEENVKNDKVIVIKRKVFLKSLINNFIHGLLIGIIIGLEICKLIIQ